MFKVIPYHMEKMMLSSCKVYSIDHAGSYRDYKDRRNKGVAMTDRFSKLYKESAVKKAEQNLSLQLSKAKKAVSAGDNGTFGIKISEGKNQGKILGHKKTDAKKI